MAAPIKKMSRSLINGAQTGWFSSGTTPARLMKRRRATPPNLGGELPSGGFATFVLKVGSELRRGIAVPLLPCASPPPLFCFSAYVYDERMQEKFLKTPPLSLVEKLDARLLLRVLSDFRRGNFYARLPVDSTGVAGKIYDTINEIIDLNARLTKDLGRMSTVVGKEGKIRHRASVPGATGGWADCVDSVNSLDGDLIQPITDVSRVIGAVA